MTKIVVCTTFVLFTVKIFVSKILALTYKAENFFLACDRTHFRKTVGRNASANAMLILISDLFLSNLSTNYSTS